MSPAESDGQKSAHGELNEDGPSDKTITREQKYIKHVFGLQKCPFQTERESFHLSKCDKCDALNNIPRKPRCSVNHKLASVFHSLFHQHGAFSSTPILPLPADDPDSSLCHFHTSAIIKQSVFCLQLLLSRGRRGNASAAFMSSLMQSWLMIFCSLDCDNDVFILLCGELTRQILLHKNSIRSSEELDRTENGRKGINSTPFSELSYDYSTDQVATRRSDSYEKLKSTNRPNDLTVLCDSVSNIGFIFCLSIRLAHSFAVNMIQKLMNENLTSNDSSSPIDVDNATPSVYFQIKSRVDHGLNFTVQMLINVESELFMSDQINSSSKIFCPWTSFAQFIAVADLGATDAVSTQLAAPAVPPLSAILNMPDAQMKKLKFEDMVPSVMKLKAIPLQRAAVRERTNMFCKLPFVNSLTENSTGFLKFNTALSCLVGTPLPLDYFVHKFSQRLNERTKEDMIASMDLDPTETPPDRKTSDCLLSSKAIEFYQFVFESFSADMEIICHIIVSEKLSLRRSLETLLTTLANFAFVQPGRASVSCLLLLAWVLKVFPKSTVKEAYFDLLKTSLAAFDSDEISRTSEDLQDTTTVSPPKPQVNEQQSSTGSPSPSYSTGQIASGVNDQAGVCCSKHEVAGLVFIGVLLFLAKKINFNELWSTLTPSSTCLQMFASLVGSVHHSAIDPLSSPIIHPLLSKMKQNKKNSKLENRSMTEGEMADDYHIAELNRILKNNNFDVNSITNENVESVWQFYSSAKIYLLVAVVSMNIWNIAPVLTGQFITSFGFDISRNDLVATAFSDLTHFLVERFDVSTKSFSSTPVRRPLETGTVPNPLVPSVFLSLMSSPISSSSLSPDSLSENLADIGSEQPSNESSESMTVDEPGLIKEAKGTADVEIFNAQTSSIEFLVPIWSAAQTESSLLPLLNILQGRFTVHKTRLVHVLCALLSARISEVRAKGEPIIYDKLCDVLILENLFPALVLSPIVQPTNHPLHLFYPSPSHASATISPPSAFVVSEAIWSSLSSCLKFSERIFFYNKFFFGHLHSYPLQHVSSQHRQLVNRALKNVTASSSISDLGSPDPKNKATIPPSTSTFSSTSTPTVVSTVGGSPFIRFLVGTKQRQWSARSRQTSEQICQTMAVNPFESIDCILHNVEMFDAMVLSSILEFLKALTRLAADISYYFILERQHSRELFEGGTWSLYAPRPKRLRNQALFAARFLRRFAWLPHRQLIRSTLSRLQSEFKNMTDTTIPLRYPDHITGAMGDALYLSEIVTWVGSFPLLAIEELSSSQIESLACGPQMKMLMWKREDLRDEQLKAAGKTIQHSLQAVLSESTMFTKIILTLSILMYTVEWDSEPIPPKEGVHLKLFAVSNCFDFLSSILDHILSFLEFLNDFHALSLAQGLVSPANQTPRKKIYVNPSQWPNLFVIAAPALAWRIVRLCAAPSFSDATKSIIALTSRATENEWNHFVDSFVRPQFLNPSAINLASRDSLPSLSEPDPAADVQMLSQNSIRVEPARHAFPSLRCTYLSCDCILVFWLLEYSDIHHSISLYKSQITKLNSDIAALSALMQQSQGAAAKPADISSIRSQTVASPPNIIPREEFVDAEISYKKLLEFREALTKENMEKVRSVQHVRDSLRPRCQTWFAESEIPSDEINEKRQSRYTFMSMYELVRYLILPRVMHSPADALYCIEFLKVLILYSPPALNFGAILYYLTVVIPPLCRSATDLETDCLGLFMAGLFGFLASLLNPHAEEYKTYKELPSFELPAVPFSVCMNTSPDVDGMSSTPARPVSPEATIEGPSPEVSIGTPETPFRDSSKGSSDNTNWFRIDEGHRLKGSRFTRHQLLILTCFAESGFADAIDFGLQIAPSGKSATIASVEEGTPSTDAGVSWVDQKRCLKLLNRCHEFVPLSKQLGEKLTSKLPEIIQGAQDAEWRDVELTAKSLERHLMVRKDSWIVLPYQVLKSEWHSSGPGLKAPSVGVEEDKKSEKMGSAKDGITSGDQQMCDTNEKTYYDSTGLLRLFATLARHPEMPKLIPKLRPAPAAPPREQRPKVGATSVFSQRINSLSAKLSMTGSISPLVGKITSTSPQAEPDKGVRGLSGDGKRSSPSSAIPREMKRPDFVSGLDAAASSLDSGQDIGAPSAKRARLAETAPAGLPVGERAPSLQKRSLGGVRGSSASLSSSASGDLVQPKARQEKPIGDGTHVGTQSSKSKWSKADEKKVQSESTRPGGRRMSSGTDHSGRRNSDEVKAPGVPREQSELNQREMSKPSARDVPLAQTRDSSSSSRQDQPEVQRRQGSSGGRGMLDDTSSRRRSEGEIAEDGEFETSGSLGDDKRARRVEVRHRKEIRPEQRDKRSDKDDRGGRLERGDNIDRTEKMKMRSSMDVNEDLKNEGIYSSENKQSVSTSGPQGSTDRVNRILGRRPSQGSAYETLKSTAPEDSTKRPTGEQTSISTEQPAYKHAESRSMERGRRGESAQSESKSASKEASRKRDREKSDQSKDMESTRAGEKSSWSSDHLGESQQKNKSGSTDSGKEVSRAGSPRNALPQLVGHQSRVADKSEAPAERQKELRPDHAGEKHVDSQNRADGDRKKRKVEEQKIAERINLVEYPISPDSGGVRKSDVVGRTQSVNWSQKDTVSTPLDQTDANIGHESKESSGTPAAAMRHKVDVWRNQPVESISEMVDVSKLESAAKGTLPPKAQQKEQGSRKDVPAPVRSTSAAEEKFEPSKGEERQAIFLKEKVRGWQQNRQFSGGESITKEPEPPGSNYSRPIEPSSNLSGRAEQRQDDGYKRQGSSRRKMDEDNVEDNFQDTGIPMNVRKRRNSSSSGGDRDVVTGPKSKIAAVSSEDRFQRDRHAGGESDWYDTTSGRKDQRPLLRGYTGPEGPNRRPGITDGVPIVGRGHSGLDAANPDSAVMVSSQRLLLASVLSSSDRQLSSGVNRMVADDAAASQRGASWTVHNATEKRLLNHENQGIAHMSPRPVHGHAPLDRRQPPPPSMGSRRISDNMSPSMSSEHLMADSYGRMVAAPPPPFRGQDLGPPDASHRKIMHAMMSEHPMLGRMNHMAHSGGVAPVSSHRHPDGRVPKFPANYLGANVMPQLEGRRQSGTVYSSSIPTPDSRLPNVAGQFKFPEKR